MKEALISPSEPRETGYRVAQVVDEGQTFEVGGCFWTPCADDVVQDQFWYDPTDESIQPFPVAIYSITYNDLLATLTTAGFHYLKTGNQVVLSNQLPLIYSGTYNINVINENSFSYTLNEIPKSNAIELGVYTINY